MAQESCNLDKEETELLKPNSSPTLPPKPSPQSLLQKPNDEIPTNKPEITITDPSIVAKPRKESFNPANKFNNRCLICHKKVGIPGFRCRCGELFCAKHRYSDTHDCSFDYKTAGREEIARANPVIRAAKIIKI